MSSNVRQNLQNIGIRTRGQISQKVVMRTTLRDYFLTLIEITGDKNKYENIYNSLLPYTNVDKNYVYDFKALEEWVNPACYNSEITIGEILKIASVMFRKKAYIDSKLYSPVECDEIEKRGQWIVEEIMVKPLLDIYRKTKL